MKRLSIEDYHIGWICALPEELAASKAMLDEVHDMISEKTSQDSNTYVLGRIHDHNVVMASLPAGIDGTNAASTTATNLLRTFKAVRIGLMVGIGGGIPNIQQGRDIRLGDVAVSQPSGRSGGIVQYDKGKKLGNGSFEHKGQLNSPPTALLTALANLRGDHMMTGSLIPRYLKTLSLKYPRMCELGFGSSSGLHDTLRCSRDHQVAAVCQNCDSGEVRRNPRRRDEPQVHYGVIASVNQVIKSAFDRDHIRDETDAICIEMEAAGLMNDFPCLVIRGIADYADGSKNDAWHNYAAAVAAAFAKELLSYVSARDASVEQPMQKLVDTLRAQHLDTLKYHKIQERHNQNQMSHNQQREANDRAKELHACHQGLYTSVYTDHKDINRPPVTGTCRWVLDHPHYLKWYNTLQDDLLWISADPGCGKSVLTKYLIDHHLRGADVPLLNVSLNIKALPHTVCYFFFKDNAIQSNLATALSAILHQLFVQQPMLTHHALPSYQRKGAQLSKDVNDMWRILQDAVYSQEAKSVICVFDALDECCDTDREKLLTLVCDTSRRSDRMTSGQHGWLKILMTSRPYHDIEDGFYPVLRSFPSIHIRGEDKNDEIHREIDLVIQAKVEDLARRRCLSNISTKRLKDKLLGAENRTYLWLYLTLEDIEETLRNSLHPDEEQFSTLPQSVEQAYDKILKRGVTEKNRPMVRAIFTVVIGARRALTLGEMAIALNLASTSKRARCIADLSVDTDQLTKNIRHWCGLFIFINHGKLYLIHQTAKEFLLVQSDMQISGLVNVRTWKHCLRTMEVERDMAQILVTFLSLKDFDSHTYESGHQPNAKRARIILPKPATRPVGMSTTSAMQWLSEVCLGSSPSAEIVSFFCFAADRWAQHLKHARNIVDNTTRTNILSLYDGSRPQFSVLVSRQLSSAIVANNAMNEVHFAVYNGDVDTLQHLLRRAPHLINSRNYREETPLYIAVDTGNLDTIPVLLQAGAKVDARCTFDRTALMKAAEMDSVGALEVLLDAGANIDNQDNLGQTALIKAAEMNSVGALGILLDAGSNVHDRDNLGQTALMKAAEMNSVGALEALLDAGSNIHDQDRLGQTALLIASSRCRGYKVVEKLLTRGACVDTCDFQGDSALLAVSCSNSVRWVRNLLAAGVEVNSAGSWGTALLQASRLGHHQVVQLLLEAKADANIPWDCISRADGRVLRGSVTALDLADIAQHSDVKELLLKAGARYGVGHPFRRHEWEFLSPL